MLFFHYCPVLLSYFFFLTHSNLLCLISFMSLSRHYWLLYYIYNILVCLFFNCIVYSSTYSSCAFTPSFLLLSIYILHPFFLFYLSIFCFLFFFFFCLVLSLLIFLFFSIVLHYLVSSSGLALQTTLICFVLLLCFLVIVPHSNPTLPPLPPIPLSTLH